MKVRYQAVPDSDKLEGLEEVNRLLYVLLRLCTMLVNSAIKPVTGLPIIKPVKTILARLKKLNKIYSDKLKDLKVQAQIERNLKEYGHKKSDDYHPSTVSQRNLAASILLMSSNIKAGVSEWRR